jgi:phosphinothricin acetyltransferase
LLYTSIPATCHLELAVSETEPLLELTLRDATPDDAAAICKAYNAYVGNGFITFDLEGKPLEHFVDKLANKYPGEAWLVACTVDGSVAGYGCLFPYSDRCGYKTTGETSVYLLPDQRGRGIGHAIKQALIARAREMGYHTLIAKLVADNTASMENNVRNGYEVAGRLRESGYVDGRWHDVVILQLML